MLIEWSVWVKQVSYRLYNILYDFVVYEVVVNVTGFMTTQIKNMEWKLSVSFSVIRLKVPKHNEKYFKISVTSLLKSQKAMRQ